jgi:hypothetical protein
MRLWELRLASALAAFCGSLLRAKSKKRSVIVSGNHFAATREIVGASMITGLRVIQVHCVSLVLIGLLATCTPAAVPTTSPQKTNDTNTVVITAQEFGTTVTARVGQTLVIPRPTEHETWRVSYSPEIVRPLDAATLRNPGKGGWRFRVAGSGETDLSFEPVSEPSRDETPGPGVAQQRFVVTIRASN